MNATSPPSRILLVEDEECDVLDFVRACQRYDLGTSVSIARDAASALRILREEPVAGGRYLIVTDLNLPRLTGHDLIEEIREDARLSSSVIFVFSSSNLSADIERAYASHVAGYIVKDCDGEKLGSGVAMLANYLKAVSLPS